MIPTVSVEVLAGALPRTPLAVLPTPLVAAPRLAAALGTGPLLVKRDDLTGFAFGGKQGPAAGVPGRRGDRGGRGHAAHRRCGGLELLRRRRGRGPPRRARLRAGDRGPAASRRVPALALARSWGATVRWTGVPERDSVDAALPAAAHELAAAGRRPYLIPRGGATGLGAVGYALAAAELRAQLDGDDVTPPLKGMPKRQYRIHVQ